MRRWSEDHAPLSDLTSTLDESLPHSHNVPWGLGMDEVPTSDPSEAARSVADVDSAIQVGQRNGLRHPMTVALPGDVDEVYSASGYAFQDPGKDRTVHRPVRRPSDLHLRLGDYSAQAKVVVQGIALHEGRCLGVVNFWATALFCTGVIFMCVTGRSCGGAACPVVVAPCINLPLRATPAFAPDLIGSAGLEPARAEEQLPGPRGPGHVARHPDAQEPNGS